MTLEIPAFLRIPADVRRAAWLASPPRPMPKFIPVAIATDADTEAALAEIAEEKRRASLNRIAKMKSKMSQGKVSIKTHRWNAGRGRFEPLAAPEWKLQRGREEHVRFMEMYPDARPLEEKPMYHVAKNYLIQSQNTHKVALPSTGPNLDLVTKDNAERVARRNGVWKDSYGTLQAGLMTMSVKNRLKRLVKDGHDIMWD